MTRFLLAALLAATLQDPGPEAHLYEIPWPAGKTYPVLAGNGQGSTHQGEMTHSWDFSIPVGHVITAARGGKVISVLDHGKSKRGMGVTIDHGDGTMALYGHLMRDGILVKMGETVLTGEPLAKIGREAGGASPHLHYHVTTEERLQTHYGAPVASNLKGPGGQPWRPRKGQAVASSNATPANLSDIRAIRRVRPLLEAAVSLRAYDLALKLHRKVRNCDRALADKHEFLRGPLDYYDGLKLDLDEKILAEVDSAIASQAWSRAHLLAGLALRECRNSKLTKEFKKRIDTLKGSISKQDEKRLREELRTRGTLIQGITHDMKDAWKQALQQYEKAAKGEGPAAQLAAKLKAPITPRRFD